MRINWEQWSILNDRLRNIRNDIFDTRNKTTSIDVKLDQILKNQQEEIFKAHSLVILYNGVTDIKVYEHGKDITEGITRIVIEPVRPPRIEYEKIITDKKGENNDE